MHARKLQQTLGTKRNSFPASSNRAATDDADSQLMISQLYFVWTDHLQILYRVLFGWSWKGPAEHMAMSVTDRLTDLAQLVSTVQRLIFNMKQWYCVY